MALREAHVAIRFAGGVNTKSDVKTVPTTQLLALENGIFSKATSLVKRNGYEAFSKAIIGSASEISGHKRLANRGDELLALTANRCYSHDADVDAWADVGACFSVIGADRAAVRTGTQQTMPDHATNDGITVYAWEDSSGGVWWTVQGAAGQIHKASEQANANGISPRVVAVGSVIHVYYAVASEHRVYVLVVNPVTPSASVTPAILIDDIDGTNTVYDACATDRTGTPAVIVWHEHATSNIRLGYVDASGVLGSPATGHPSVIRQSSSITTPSPIAIAYQYGVTTQNDAELAIATVFSGLIAFATYLAGSVGGDPISQSGSNAIGAAISVQRLALVWGYGPSSFCWIAAEEADADPSERYAIVCSFTSGSVGTPRTIRSIGLASRAFQAGENADTFAVFVHDTTYFNTYLTLRLSDFAPVGRHLPGLGAGAPTRKHLPSANVVGDVVSITLPYRERLLSENNDKFRETGIRLVTMDFDDPDTHQATQLGLGLYLAGACPLHYDGRAWTEQGFHFGPELVATTPAAGGSMTASTTYLYRYWYEWTDAQGEVHRGPMSFGTLVTMAGGQTQVTHTLPTLRVTGKSNVRICVGRSRAAATGATAELFRVSSLDPTATGANGYIANSKTVDTVTFLDRMSDATLATQEPIYTNGGILSNDPPALGAIIAGGKSRLFFSDPSDGNAVRYSNEIEDGYGVEIPPELVIKTDPRGGPITALASMDDALVIFKESSIFVCGGDGPTPNGDTSVSGFSKPRGVPGDIGCADPASIVEIPAGLMFRSSKGIWLLDRGGSLSYVGAPVEAYNAQSVRRATTLPDRTAVIFLTDSGKTLLYDHLFSQWSTFTNHEGYDSTVIGGVYHYLRTDGRVFRETPGVYSDAGSRIVLRLETAWIHLQEHLQGFQFFRHMHLLGARRSAHQLAMQYQLGFQDRWTEPWYVDATGIASQAGWISGDQAPWIGTGDDSLLGTLYGEGNYGDGPYGGTAPGAYAWRMHIGTHGKSIRFRFEDFEAAGYTGASFELTEIVIVGGVKGPVERPYSAGRSV